MNLRPTVSRLSRSRWWLPSWYLAVAISAGIAYPFIKAIMINQQTWFYAVKSNITFNFLLFLFLYGVLADRLTKKMSRRKSWIVWAAGLLAIMLFFRFVGGYETILG